ncbi:putative hydrolase [Candidatus Fokinia solitaria]|uniref:Putative hydrolase n=1 Tax=Candidatus Fokinia solitaria TaxID=1802984 RepID=A0A2U8BS99_9RICK|nr:dienelactone hydrolase family protein [Candidatus Fokinia solitaria]AWD33178.1 putative hydrolase [Candidatus Fokinia solitaria]
MQKCLLFSFHGYGANGANMRSVVTSFMYGLSDVDTICPDGIAPFEEAPWKRDARMWFSLRNSTQSMMQELACNAASDVLAYVLEKAKEHNVRERNIILTGFSQGAMLAWELAKILPEVPRAVIGMSGLIVTPARTIDSVRADNINKKTSILFCHGSLDSVIPLQQMKQSLSALDEKNIKYELFIDNGAEHTVTDSMIEKIHAFLKRIIVT